MSSALVIVAVLSACGKKDEQAAAGGATAAPPKPAGAAPAAGAAGPPKGLPVKASPVKVGDGDERGLGGGQPAGRGIGHHPAGDRRAPASSLHFQEGQAVLAGAKLVTLDASEVKAQLAAAEAQVRTDKQRLERTKELLDQKFISQDAYDVAKNNWTSAPCGQGRDRGAAGEDG